MFRASAPAPQRESHNPRGYTQSAADSPRTRRRSWREHPCAEPFIAMVAEQTFGLRQQPITREQQLWTQAAPLHKARKFAQPQRARDGYALQVSAFAPMRVAARHGV